ncbi:D-aminoacylase [Nonomuraea sp. KC401]|uniref:N-acyl-D-amino-acid deacylase family protein n=1 Tax=unclassified Nonomuraea TaxID=2593643 RepID=UPI0010FE5FFF|nr:MULTISPECIES: D-aminoacylase [unclassified Nonomuraea]NBE92646.1 amidohydrolase family protein [Nonomuraea sp. K271]TLF84597.1 D-aminoacylase [Nonomuraea sp. KC401]
MSTTLVIRGGTVHDGSGGPGRVADVFVEGDRILAVGPGGAEADAPVLDATGLVVAPGFVNVLSHAYFTLERDGRGLSDLYQGVTTQVFGEGISIGPLTAAIRAELEPGMTPDDPPLTWERLSEFLAHLEAKGVAQNVASFVGAHNMRMIGAGADDRPMTAAELSHVRGVLDEEMADGALGLGSALIYPPGCFAPTDELVALCEVVARHGGMYISHMRSEGDHFLDAVDELIEIGRRAELHAEIYHLKTAGRHNWPKMERAIERIEAARAAGRPVTADVYPYLAGQTQLAASIPPQFHDGGHGALVARLADPGERARIREAVVTPSERWENLYLAAGGASGVMLLPDPDGPVAEHRGLSLAQAAEADGADPVELLLRLVEQEPALHAMYFMMSEDTLRTALREPWVSVCSDAPTFAAEPPDSDVPTHPRAYGSFARILGTYVREQSLLTLGEAVRRMSGLPAGNLGLRDRGVLAPGNYADVVVFDPSTVGDVATYDNPHQYATGMRHVVVNGQTALADGVPTGRLPGRALRRRR